MKHVMIGPVPPPLGGISVYVDRRSRKLRTEGHLVQNLDFARLSFAQRIAALAGLVLSPAPATFELHAYDFSAMLALLARPFPKKIRYMDHNTLLYDHDVTGIRKRILKKFMAKAEVSFVSEAGLGFYQRGGFSFGSAEVRTAYLPPPPGDETQILGTYKRETTEFLASANPLIVANASQIVFVDGIDLYGLDMCVDLLIRVRAQHPNAGFLFALANDAPNRSYLEQIRAKLAGEGAADRFHFLSGQRELWPVFGRAHLFVRPTTGDGFAVSIAEAQELGCSVLASDAVRRPPGVTLFRSRDGDDFAAKALEILAHRKVDA